MNIQEEILKAFGETDSNTQLLLKDSIDRMIFLQNKLHELERHPFVKYHPDDPSKQKVLPAFKVYISLTQQYNNIVFKLCSVLQKTSSKGEADSPLREYMRNLNGKK